MLKNGFWFVMSQRKEGEPAGDVILYVSDLTVFFNEFANCSYDIISAMTVAFLFLWPFLDLGSVD